MVIGGSSVPLIWGYIPDTRPAIAWIQKADGNWSASDRGAAEDVYEGSIIFQGPESELNALETVLAANRETIACTFAEGEEVFGAELDYSGAYTVAVVNYGDIQRLNFPHFSMRLRLRLVGAPAFKSLTPSLSNLRLSDWNYSPNSAYDINKRFSYDGTGSYQDGATDPGTFKAVFKQTPSEMEEIRRYLLLTKRTGSFTFPSIGIDYPFGQRMGTGPFTVKATSWKDRGRASKFDWEIEITFTRVF